MPYGNNMYGGGMPPSNNLWVGNNYSQTPRTNYSPQMNQTNGMDSSFMQSQSQMRQQMSFTNILRVMGIESAKAYQIGPDSQVILLDAHEPFFYIKQTDSAGYPVVRAFSFNEVPLSSLPGGSTQNQEKSVNQDYVTKSDFDDFKKMIEDLVMKNE